MGVSNKLSRMRLGVSPAVATPQSFTDSFESLLSHSASLPCLHSPQPHHESSQPALPRLCGPTPCCMTSLPSSTPPTGLGKCFFNPLVVRVLCSLIFWHFWLFIVFRLVVILLVVQGSKAFLPTSPSWP